MKKFILASLALGACALTSGSSYAALTEWEEPAKPALNFLRPLVATQGGGQVVLMPEFPHLDPSAPQGWDPVGSTFMVPANVSADYTISELNNAGAYCDKFQQLTDAANTSTLNITKVWGVGLDLVEQLTSSLKDADLFKVTLNNDPSQPFIEIATVQAELDGLDQSIGFEQSLATTLGSTISSRVATDTTMKATYASLVQDSQTGIPNTADAQTLQSDIAKLQSTASGYQSTIDTLKAADPSSSAIAVIQGLLDGTKAQIKVKQDALNTLAAPYRQQKAADAATYKSSQLDPFETKTANLQAQLDTANQTIIDKQQLKADTVVDPAYTAAKGKVDQLNVMLDTIQGLMDKLSTVRLSATKDAIFAINFATANINDWAQIDAGVAAGVFPIFTQDITKIPGEVSNSHGYTVGLANLYDVLVHADVTDLLNSPIAQLPLNSVDPSTGTVTPLPTFGSNGINGQTFTAKNSVEIVNPADLVAENFPLPVNAKYNDVAAQIFTKRTKLSNSTPTIKLHMGLATYCGQLRTSSVQGADIPYTVAGKSYVVRPSRTAFSYQPRNFSSLATSGGKPFFPTTLNGQFNLEEQFKPNTANCQMHISDYGSYTRNWGSEEHNYVFYSWKHSWDDTKIDTYSNHTMKCAFEHASADDPNKAETDGFNQMAVAEVLGQFILANAKQPMAKPPASDPQTLSEFKSAFPRNTWSPAMMAVCGGEPICELVGIVLDNVGSAVQSSSTSVTRTGSADMSLNIQNSYAGMVPHNFGTSVRFFVQ